MQWTLLSVQISSSSSWVQVGECFFWYRLTRIVVGKGPLNDRVCVRIYILQYNAQS